MMDTTSSKGLFLVSQKSRCSEDLAWVRKREAGHDDRLCKIIVPDFLSKAEQCIILVSPTKEVCDKTIYKGTTSLEKTY